MVSADMRKARMGFEGPAPLLEAELVSLMRAYYKHLKQADPKGARQRMQKLARAWGDPGLRELYYAKARPYCLEERRKDMDEG